MWGVQLVAEQPSHGNVEYAFKRADMTDTKIGSQEKMNAADVARIGFKAMMDGEGDVVAGLHNKLRAAMAHVAPSAALAEMHRRQAEPGTAKQ